MGGGPLHVKRVLKTRNPVYLLVFTFPCER